MMRKISIIVPVYNADKYVDKCIKSILEQTYANFELIIIDDGSTDQSAAICDEWSQKDSRIKVVHVDNGGVSRARNIGIGLSTGSWISFVDADDYIMNNYLSDLLNVTLVNKGVDWVFCDYYDEINGKRINSHIYEKEKEGLLSNTSQLYKKINGIEEKKWSSSSRFAGVWGKLYSEYLIKKNNISFPENVYIREDVIFNMKYCSRVRQAYYLRKPLYVYNNLDDSASRRSNDNFKYEADSFMKELFECCKGEKDAEEIISFNALVMLYKIVILKTCRISDLELKDLCEDSIYKRAFLSKCHGYNIKKRIVLFALKYKFYNIVRALCYLKKKEKTWIKLVL